MVVYGPPGTGKTYTIIEMLKPFFCDNEPHGILICSANNAGVDNTINRAHEVLIKLQTEGKASPAKYVIRLHSFHTERDITEKDAKANRLIPEGSRPQYI
jgi:DNA polymerase III delta prime subunit